MVQQMKDVTGSKDTNPLGRQKAYPYSDMITFWYIFLEMELIMWHID